MKKKKVKNESELISNTIHALTALVAIGLISCNQLLAQNNHKNSNFIESGTAPTSFPAINVDFPIAVQLPGYINSSHREIGPLTSPDGKTIYFSRQYYPLCNAGIFGFMDLWYSTFNDTTNMWSRPVNFGPPIADSGPNSVNFISVSADTVLFVIGYKKDGMMTDGIAMSTRQKGDWSFPQPIGVNFRMYADKKDNIFLAHNMPAILTSGKKDDSYGGSDIYVTLIHPDGTASTKNLGHVINTEQDESSPFLSDDNKSLYFASRGHTGFGGYDIFVSQRQDETWQNWSEPVNLGPAINTDKDEEFFKLSKDGQYAYFTRQVSRNNSDIFEISMPACQQARLNNK